MRRAVVKLPTLIPIERETVQEKVYRQLRNALMRGKFSPGDFITHNALADAFGTSSMPVREAIRQLVAEQALIVLPNRKVVLPVVTPERLREMKQLRIAVEGMVTEEAALHITPLDIGKLRALTQKMSTAGNAGDVKRYLEYNQDFHFTIYRASMMDFALKMIESMWLQIGPVLNLLLTLDVKDTGPGIDPAKRSNGHHCDAVAALEKGDGPAARQAIANDISEAAEFIIKSRHFGIAQALSE